MLRRLRKRFLDPSLEHANSSENDVAQEGEDHQEVEDASSSLDGDRRKETQDMKKKDDEKPSVTFLQLFKYTNKKERFSLIISSIAAIVAGASFPLFALVGLGGLSFSSGIDL